MSTKNPTLKKIGGVFCYRLAFGTRFAEGDRWDNNVLTDLFDLRVDTTTELLGGMWRPVVVPSGYRIRDLDETAQAGDFSGAIKNGVLRFDPSNAGPLPSWQKECGKTVRWILSRTEILRLDEPSSYFYGDDFVVLAPVVKPVEAPKLPEGYRLLGRDEKLPLHCKFYIVSALASLNRWVDWDLSKPDTADGRCFGLTVQGYLDSHAVGSDTFFVAVVSSCGTTPRQTPSAAPSTRRSNP